MAVTSNGQSIPPKCGIEILVRLRTYTLQLLSGPLGDIYDHRYNKPSWTNNTRRDCCDNNTRPSYADHHQCLRDMCTALLHHADATRRDLQEDYEALRI